MAEIRRSPVDMVNYPHYLGRVSYIPGWFGWLFGISEPSTVGKTGKILEDDDHSNPWVSGVFPHDIDAAAEVEFVVFFFLGGGVVSHVVFLVRKHVCAYPKMDGL